MVLFTVVIPVYNIEKYLNDCLDSLVHQMFTDFEVILVDDGSTDSSATICDSYAKKDSRFQVIHKKNEGVSIARRTGVNCAKGQYIVFIDGDDWVSCGYLSEMARPIMENQAEIVCMGFTCVTSGKQAACPLPYEAGNYLRSDMEKNIFPSLIESEDGSTFSPSLWGKAIHRDLYRKYQLSDYEVRIGEDDACLKPCIYHSNSIEILSAVSYYYRQNPTSATKNIKPRAWNEAKKIAIHFEKNIDMKRYDLQEQQYRNIVHRLFNICISQFAREEGYTAIKKEILVSLQDPFYSTAIAHASFRSDNWRGRLALTCLKKHWILLMYAYYHYLTK